MAFAELQKADILMLADLANEVNLLAKICRKASNRWWHEPLTGAKLDRNHGELFMLMVTELAEGFEGIRQNKMDDKLPHRLMVEVELADTIIRILDYAGEHKLDVGGAIYEKMKYNSTRKDHSKEARLAPGGKKF